MGVHEIIRTELFMLVLVLGVYIFGLFLYKKTKLSLLHPVLTSIALIILFLKIFKVDYKDFQQGSRVIDFLLGPSVVALGYLLYEQYEHIKANMVSILTAIVVGSFVGIVSVILIAQSLGANHILIATLQPKSVTTPIAMEISKNSGGLPGLTAVVVVSVGIFGAMVGPFALNKLGIESKIARGLAMGASAHGVGTARAIELGAIEGAISGLAIGLMGVITAIWVPVIEFFLSLF